MVIRVTLREQPDGLVVVVPDRAEPGQVVGVRKRLEDQSPVRVPGGVVDPGDARRVVEVVTEPQDELRLVDADDLVELLRNSLLRCSGCGNRYCSNQARDGERETGRRVMLLSLVRLRDSVLGMSKLFSLHTFLLPVLTRII